jgi:hypothetical protein
MTDVGDVTALLADVQRRLQELPDDAFAEKFELHKEQDILREEARRFADDLDQGRDTAELLAELAALRTQMHAIEGQRIDLVFQAGSGGSSTGEMGNLGGVSLNRGMDEAMGLPKIKARIGLLKGILTDRGVEVPEASF